MANTHQIRGSAEAIGRVINVTFMMVLFSLS